MQVIPASWLRLFNPKELNELIGGGEAGLLDVDDMAAHTKYSGGYSESHATIKLFWKVKIGFAANTLLHICASCPQTCL